MFKVGDRVRHSGHVTQRARDYWCQQGEYTRKQRAKDALDKTIAARGTIIELLHNGVKVKWDDGTESSCLSYLVDRAPVVTFTFSGRKNAFGEFVLRCYQDGVRHEKGDYFTNDKADALATLQAEQARQKGGAA